VTFTYEALDRSGSLVRDSIDARTLNDALEALRAKGLFVNTCTDIQAATPATKRRGPRTVGRGKRLKYLAMFARQLHVLVATGIPLTQALEALERQVPPGPWHDVVASLRAAVEQGTPLSEAMSKHPGYFDTVVVSMVEAGETSGNFAAMLDRMAGMTKKQLHVRNSIVGSMIYPCLLLVVSINVLITMLTFVLPRFAELFKTLDTALPPATLFLMFLSHMLTSYWWAFLAGAIAVPWLIKLWLNSTAGRRTVNTILIRAPKFGLLIRNFLAARLVRTLGTLLQSKVQLLDALRLTRQGTLNHHYSDLLEKAEQAVTRGDPISSAFAKGDLVPASVYEALRNGERSGQVGPLLLNMAEFMDEENEVILKSLTSIIEPLILIVLGFLVGGVALAMFMPLFDLTAAASRG
jgi:type IV pilus assembly protein PilC